MKRVALFKGSAVSHVVASKADARWDVYDVNGFHFVSCPFRNAVAPVCGLFTVTPSMDAWTAISQAQRDTIDLVELCLSKAPISPDQVEGQQLFAVSVRSPWYVPANVPANVPPISRAKRPRGADGRLSSAFNSGRDDEVIAPLTQRRFMSEDDET